MDHLVAVEQDSEQSPIHVACTSGDVSRVTTCLEETAQPRALVNKYHEGLTPLHAAALSGSAHACDVMRVLLEHGAEVNAQTLGDENTALHLVVEKGVFPRDFSIIAFLIENGISRSLRNRKLRTAYDCAMGLGHYEVAATLDGSVPTGQLWNVYKEETGLRYGPCISEAVLNGDLKMLEEAIRLGGNPNIINKHGAGAIHYAVTHCSLPVMDVLEKLVDAGADVNLRDDEGDNVLNLAIKSKQLWENDQMAEVVIFLRSCGAEASFKDLDGKDAFDLAGERGYHDIIEILRGPQVTPRPTKQPAADVNTPNSEGLYPIHLAVQKEESQDRTAEVDSVIQRGARVNQTIEQTGNTALHLCAILDHSDTADQLLRHGVDHSLKNKDGKTAYDLAKERGHRGVMAVIEAKLKGTQDKMEKEKSGSCHIL